MQAILVLVLPPAGEAPRSAEHSSATHWRVMSEKARPSPCYRRCGKPQFLPHPPAVSREIDGCHLPPLGEGLYAGVGRAMPVPTGGIRPAPCAGGRGRRRKDSLRYPPCMRWRMTPPPCGARKTLRAYAFPRVFRPLRKLRPRSICHRQRKAAIPSRREVNWLPLRGSCPSARREASPLGHTGTEGDYETLEFTTWSICSHTARNWVLIS